MFIITDFWFPPGSCLNRVLRRLRCIGFARRWFFALVFTDFRGIIVFFLLVFQGIRRKIKIHAVEAVIAGKWF